MTTQPDTENQRGAPRWLLPAMVGAIILLAALLAVVLTGRLVPARPAPAASSPEQQAAATAHAGATGEAVPQAHGGLNPEGPAVEVISLAEARALFDAGKAIFVDVRSGSAFSAGHIPGALTITSRELEERLKDLPDGAMIIAYGDAERPESGQRGAQIFMELGYPRVIALEGGFQAWRDAGHPVEP